MTEDKVFKLYKQYQTPAHVIEHCKKVAFVADKIAAEYERKGIDVDSDAIYFAALLHDLLRAIDFPSNKKNTDVDHSWAAYNLLNEMGESKIANMIKKHAFGAIVDEDNKPFTLEEKILNYADKRVLHDRIVSLKERFEDGKKRYNPKNLQTERQQKIHDTYFDLEKELFAPIDINSEDI